MPCCKAGRCCCAADRLGPALFLPCLLQIQRKLIAALCLAFVFMIIEVRKMLPSVLGLSLASRRFGRWCGGWSTVAGAAA